MAEFPLIDLTESSEPGASTTIRGEAQGVSVGRVDTTEFAAGLEALRQDLTAQIEQGAGGLSLAEVKIKLTLSAEGKVAFVAKGAAEACVEVVFRAAR